MVRRRVAEKYGYRQIIVTEYTRMKLKELMKPLGALTYDEAIRELIRVYENLEREKASWNTLRVIKTNDNYTLYLIKEPLFIEKKQTNDETVYYIYYDTYIVEIKERPNSIDYSVEVLL